MNDHNRLMHRDHNTWQQNTICDHFESGAAFSNWLARKLDEEPRKCCVSVNKLKEAIDKGLGRGSPELGRILSERIYDFNVDSLVSDGLAHWAPSCVGVVPVVPNVLIGIPETMLSRTTSPISASGPITIVFDRGLSGGTDVQSVIQYGAAVMSLVLTLQRVRPVDIIVTSTNKGMGKTHVPMVHVGSAPFDPAQLAFWLADVEVERSMAFQHKFFYEPDHRNGWGWGLYAFASEMERRIAELAAPIYSDCLVIGPARYADLNLIKTNAKGWIEKQLRAYAPQLFLD